MYSIPQAFPPAWARYRSELSGRVTLDVAGYATCVEITPEQLDRVYLPVLALLRAKSEALGGSDGTQPRSRRLLAGLAGIPGGGKSTFAAVLAHIGQCALESPGLVVIGMDGWHYSTAELDGRSIIDEAGRAIPLRHRKGSPPSFNVAAMAAVMRELRLAGRSMTVPVYDRRLHEPIANGFQVGADVPIVLIEGNYILDDSLPWRDVSSLLDLKLYLRCEPASARERIIARHIRGGLTSAAAVRKYEINDAPNTRFVEQTAGRADYVVQP